LKEKILARLRPQAVARNTEPFAVGLRFLAGSDRGWKPLPIPGTYLKVLSLQADRGYAVLLGKLDPGARYPAHTNAGPEDFYILTGDLHVSERVLGPGDFHHADAGSEHAENYSVAGCTLLAVLTTDDPLVQFACS
jgi:anti-sigma factor ChrR (cupin superfamily)